MEMQITGRTMSQVRANRRSFDCASRDETARDLAQDDNFCVRICVRDSLTVRRINRSTVEQVDCLGVDGDAREGEHDTAANWSAEDAGRFEDAVSELVEYLAAHHWIDWA